MTNIYRFVPNVIRDKVPSKRGIYFLGTVTSGKFVVGYIGRSDKSLRDRLLTHNHKEKFDYFSFEVVNSRKEAFFMETEYWYLHKKKVINKIHPNKPEGLEMEHPVDSIARVIKKKFLGGNLQ